MNIDLLLLILCGFAISILGLIVYTRNPKQLTNQRFTLLALVLVGWITSNYLSDHASSNNLLFTRLTFLAGVGCAGSLVNYIAAFPVPDLYKNRLLLVVHNISTVILMPLMLTPFMVSSVSEIQGGDIQTSFLYYVFLVYIIYSLGLLTFVIRGQKRAATTSIMRRQVRLVAIGILLYAILAAVANVLLPLISDSWSTSRFGPAFTLLLVGMMAYTIIKHSLFDIRLVIARALGYILSIGTLAILYSVIVSVFFTKIFDNSHISTINQASYVVLSVLFGFTLVPMKKRFDKLTRKLFYKDAYDAQELLDYLNKILVGNVNLDAILKQTADILATTLKAEYVAFVIRETEGTSRRASFSKIVEINSEEILHIIGKKKGKTELFVADEIEGDHDKIKSTLMNNNIAIAAKLAGSGDAADQGFLLLGAKQSGNPYNKQDVQVLDIIANELVIAIQNAVRFEEIETFNITLQQKVNDATKQLRQTNEKLKALDETKDEFISMASHQLRTPLTAVKGYVSMVVEGDAGKLSKQQKELLDQAFASSQRMVYLIADLLNVSRLKSGKFVIENKPTQLADVVESEMEQLTEVAKGKEQTLTYTKPDKFPVLMLDETKIRQVIMNFADNALHYTQNGGHIQINLEDKGDSIEYTVVDDGLGVPKAEQHHLFTKFYRAGNAKKARPDGTGLGLFMAKKVVVAQGGAIIFKSEEGKGSTFGFTFPKAKMLAPSSSVSKKT